MKAYIANLEYYLPNRIEENEFGHLRTKTGIERKHICNESMTAADMAQIAAENLFVGGVDKKSVDYLLFCTQSPDYFLPTTACILQERLGLNRDIGALDFNLGCSGYVYGLGLAKGLIESEQAKNILLLTAETYSKYIHKIRRRRPATLVVGLDAFFLLDVIFLKKYNQFASLTKTLEV